MLRMTTLAVLATLALAPAANAKEVRVAVSGKSAEQLHTDIVAAARSVCRVATATESFQLDAYSRCTKATVKVALDKLADPQVAQLETIRLARR